MRSLLVLLLFAVPALAADTLKLPAEVRAPAGQPVRVKAETESKKLRWRALDAGLSVVDRDDLADQRTAVVFSCKPGRYRLAAWCCTADGDVTDLVETVVVVDGSPPNPGPGPAPPPPAPGALKDALRAAYAANMDPDKAASLASLAALWRSAVPFAARPEVETVGDLLTLVSKAAAGLTLDKLPGVRQAIAAHLRGVLPTDPAAPLTAAVRTTCAAEFARVAEALEGIAK